MAKQPLRAQLLQSQRQNVRPQGSHQERRHGRGDAAGRRRLRHSGPREIQHREGKMLAKLD
jgi:hypothetical protein